MKNIGLGKMDLNIELPIVILSEANAKRLARYARDPSLRSG
jgi:hypothetical protein